MDTPLLSRDRGVAKQWVFVGERAPRKAMTVKSANKFMATVFWDARGMIYIDHLEKEKTITGAYYALLLHLSSEEIKKKRPHLKKILFHQDNVRVHTSAVSMAKIIELKFVLLQLPPYLPDLASSDFVLFPNLKKWLVVRETSLNFYCNFILYF